MKVVFFVVFCALIAVNRAHFEKNYGQPDGHEHIDTEREWIEIEPDSTTGIEFLLRQVSEISSNALLRRKELN